MNNENENQLEDSIPTPEMVVLTAGQKLKEKCVYLPVGKTLVVVFTIYSSHIYRRKKS